ncbi:MAG: DUF3168 domain-containing protein [Selenomonadaceae bacterium]|nr:DUF3168 domain-containing protein [Selenomonadaceae bacterium]
METVQLEENIYSALTADENLMELLPNRESSIFNLKAPSVYPELPVIVYSTISDVPVLHGDNWETLHRVTVRLHIITGENDYSELYAEVKRVMSELGFTRLQATPFIDEDGFFMMITDFKIVIGDD